MILNLIYAIVNDIEIELNSLNYKTKRKLNNVVYYLGNSYLKTKYDREKLHYALIIKTSLFGKVKVQLMSSQTTNIDKTYNYKSYKNVEDFNIFDDESLVKLKYFLLSFVEGE